MPNKSRGRNASGRRVTGDAIMVDPLPPVADPDPLDVSGEKLTAEQRGERARRKAQGLWRNPE